MGSGVGTGWGRGARHAQAVQQPEVDQRDAQREEAEPADELVAGVRVGGAAALGRVHYQPPLPVDLAWGAQRGGRHVVSAAQRKRRKGVEAPAAAARERHTLCRGS